MLLELYLLHVVKDYQHSLIVLLIIFSVSLRMTVVFQRIHLSTDYIPLLKNFHQSLHDGILKLSL